MNPYELSIAQARTELDNGTLLSRDLTLSCLDRIKSVDGRIKSFLLVTEEEALQQAEAADKQIAAGKATALCGIPLAVKDLLCTKGVTTSCGSKILENFVPPYDATVIEKLKTQGAVLLGKTSMDEFAMGSTSENCAFAVPDNPWKTDYVAGGSSGGSASAVAAMECLGSLGSDTGGSIRQPASLCGIVGIKPTYGRVSRYGLVAFASSLDQIGPMNRDVTDAAIMMNAISGYDPRDSTSVQENVPDFTASLKKGMEGIRVGIPAEYYTEGLDSEVAGVVENGVQILKDAGAEIVDISLPHTEYCVAVYYLIAPAEASSNLARYDGVVYGMRSENAKSLEDMYRESRSTGFGDEVKRRILIGTYALSSGYYDAYYKKASQVRTLILQDFQKAYETCDVIISPVTPTPSWKKGTHAGDPLSLYLSDILTISANLAGIPGISVPGGFSSDGLPVGIQLQAAHFREDVLFQAAYNLELGTGLANKCPVL